MYAIRDLVVDLEKRQVYLGKQPVMLTPTEFRMLECLAERPGHSVSEETLAQEVWGNYKQSDSAVVRRYIWLLRQKLEDDPSNPKRLITVRGFGYRLGTRPVNPEEEASSSESHLPNKK
jgi:DNA-binding response OmpR family regulator